MGGLEGINFEQDRYSLLVQLHRWKKNHRRKRHKCTLKTMTGNIKCFCSFTVSSCAHYSNNPVLSRRQKELTVSSNLFADGFLILSSSVSCSSPPGGAEVHVCFFTSPVASLPALWQWTGKHIFRVDDTERKWLSFVLGNGQISCI